METDLASSTAVNASVQEALHNAVLALCNDVINFTNELYIHGGITLEVDQSAKFVVQFNQKLVSSDNQSCREFPAVVSSVCDEAIPGLVDDNITSEHNDLDDFVVIEMNSQEREEVQEDLGTYKTDENSLQPDIQEAIFILGSSEKDETEVIASEAPEQVDETLLLPLEQTTNANVIAMASVVTKDEIESSPEEGATLKNLLQPSSAWSGQHIVSAKSSADSDSNISCEKSNPASFIRDELLDIDAFVDAMRQRAKLNRSSAFQCSEETLYKCPFDDCGKTFTKLHKYRRHESMHTGVKPYHCPLCICDGFSSKRSLQDHMMSVHNDGKKLQVECKVCGVKLMAESLKSHINAKHLQLRVYSCKTCGKSFKSTDSLLKHMKVHKFVKDQYRCEHCGKCYQRRGDWDSHIKRNHLSPDQCKHICHLCEKHFYYARDYRIHLKEMHSRAGPEFFVCDTCGSKFRRKNALHAHFRSKHQGIKRKPHIPAESLYSCDQCGASASLNKAAVLRHEEAHRLHGPSLPQRCQICKFGFVVQKMRHRHLLFKHDACSICKSVFTSQPELHEHLENVHFVDLNSGDLSQGPLITEVIWKANHYQRQKELPMNSDMEAFNRECHRLFIASCSRNTMNSIQELKVNQISEESSNAISSESQPLWTLKQEAEEHLSESIRIVSKSGRTLKKKAFFDL